MRERERNTIIFCTKNSYGPQKHYFDFKKHFSKKYERITQKSS